MHNVILHTVGEYYGVSVEALKSSSRNGKLPEARKIACYFMSHFIKQSQVAREISVNRSNVLRFTKEVIFYLKRYPEIKEVVMDINKDLEDKKHQLEQWLVVNYNVDAMVVREKQIELENVINQLNK